MKGYSSTFHMIVGAVLGGVIGMLIPLPQCVSASAEPPREHINASLLMEAQLCLDSGRTPVTVLGYGAFDPLQIRCLEKKK